MCSALNYNLLTFTKYEMESVLFCVIPLQIMFAIPIRLLLRQKSCMADMCLTNTVLFDGIKQIPCGF